MRIPKPIVTADVATGSIRPVSSSRPLRRAAVIAERGEGADRDRDRCATTVVRSDIERRVERVDADADAGSHLRLTEVAPRGGRVAGAGEQRALDERHGGGDETTAVDTASATTKRR